jgi:hypothetical protein
VRLIIVAILLVCSSAVAGDAPSTQPTFADVAAQLAAPAVLRGNFSQARRIALLQNPLYSTGRFILSDKGLYWRQEQPIPALMIADEQRLMQQVGDGPMQDIDTAENPVVLSFSNSFLSIFRGNEDELRKNFDVEFSSEPGWWTIHLKPISYPMSEAIDSIGLRGREYIETITVISRTSDETIISFTDLQTEPDRLTDDELELYAR